MKLQPDRFDTQSIAAYGPDWLEVITYCAGIPQRQRITHSVIFASDGLLQPWQVERFADIQNQDFVALAQYSKEILLIGSGKRQHFIPPAMLAPLYTRRIGVETMDTASACRTYNILAQEGRHVVAALLLEA